MAAPLGACQNSGYGQKETIGTLGGAALGGFVGSQFGKGEGRLAATAAGVVLGGLLGNYVGRGLDERDRLEAERAATLALERYPDGQQASWRNPNTGNYGYTTPTSTYQDASGQWCRQYQTSIVVDGRAQTGTGTACRQPDGTWRIVS
ncbi:MAG: glycine zipper 2TM domain-containing protein [Rhodospirillaceae bacterium]|nr:glycine zipper 2TM domain-containing protein [Rhodospirillaceae bacterium]